MIQGKGSMDNVEFDMGVVWGRSRAVSTQAVKLAGAIFVIVAVFTFVGRAAHEDVVYINIADGSLDVL